MCRVSGYDCLTYAESPAVTVLHVPRPESGRDSQETPSTSTCEKIENSLEGLTDFFPENQGQNLFDQCRISQETALTPSMSELPSPSLMQFSPPLPPPSVGPEQVLCAAGGGAPAQVPMAMRKIAQRALLNEARTEGSLLKAFLQPFLSLSFSLLSLSLTPTSTTHTDG